MENVLNLIWKGGKNDDGNNVGANRLVTTLLHAFPLLFKSMCYTTVDIISYAIYFPFNG